LSTEATHTRYERRRRETADRITQAASALFGERGVEGTTIADLCDRADVARQTFFNHFDSKQDLVRELARRGHDFFVEAVLAAQKHPGSTGERLARMFSTIHGAAASVGPMHHDLVSATLGASYEPDDPADLQGLHRAVEKLIRQGRAAGDVSRRHAVEDQAVLVLGALHDLMMAWAHRTDFPIARRSNRMARLLADALAPRAGGAERS